MNLFKNISLRNTTERLTALFKRSPVASILIVTLTAYIILLIQNGWDTFSERNVTFLFSVLPTSALLTLSFHLFNEEYPRKGVNYLIETLILIGWVVFCYSLSKDQDQPGIGKISLFVTGLICIILSIFTLSFIRRKNDLPVWNFAIRVLFGAAISFIIGLILSGGVSLLFLSLDKLFGLEISDKVYTTGLTVCLVLITPILFLLQIPEGEKKQDDTVPTLSKFYRGVIQNLFIPLLICYFVTLYVYALNILIRWELPNGWVSGLVTTLMAGMLVLIFLLYPQQYQAQLKRAERFALHIAPLLTLPVLVLMSIGIFRRISDYGITVPRLYLLLFNIWCYLACIILLMKRSRNIWWLPVSFGIMAFVASIGPWSFANLTKNQLRKEVRKALTAFSPQLPLSQEQYRKWFLTQGDSAQNIASKIAYLNDFYPKTGLKDILADSVFTYISRDQIEAVEVEPVIALSKEHLLRNNLALPQGYNYVNYVENGVDVSEVMFRNDSVFFAIRDVKFGIRCQELIDELNKEKETYTLEEKDKLLVFDYISFCPERKEINFGGLLFTKEPIKKQDE